MTKRKEYNKLIQQYNDLGVNLMKFECEIEDSLKIVKIRRLEKMMARPILKYENSESTEMVVNFDPYLGQLLRRNERLCKLNLDLPSIHQYVVTRKNWFFEYRDMVEKMLETYNLTMNSLVPDLKKLYAPHLNKVKDTLEPGLSQINWTCQTWQGFVEKVLRDISIYKNLIDRSNDIFESRIEKLLEKILETRLFDLPSNDPWTLEKFLDTVKMMCKEGAKTLQKKNEMIEDAIEDLNVASIFFCLESISLISRRPDNFSKRFKYWKA